MNLKQHIAKQENKLNKYSLKLKALALEINGMFKNNIGKDRIEPKTEKSKGKTLYDTGIGIKSITSIITDGIIKTGNSVLYMGYHLTGTKNLPKRNWLMKPPKLDDVVRAWIRDFMRK